ncbi:hypothetical protein [Sphingomonas sp. Leaf4]|uniref:hypothetical protein n=1 Tax=Sphingomonas sp. Leaf4 TaxID=2876553 RepID=UPI001E588502|nr:hypothetical protein [Sphingomonas sp. Leaf4]
MIKFLQDYRTKAVPPEAFEDGQEVERSSESERYFVGLGVAAYLVDGKLYDQDYQPLTVVEVTEVVSTDRRFIDTGRGGEMLGLDAPARATTGPGNAVAFNLDPAAATGVDLQREIDLLQKESDERLRLVVIERDDLADDIFQLRGQLVEVEKARDDATARANAADTRATEAEGKLAEADGRAEAAASDLAAAVARIAELEAEASKAADTPESETAAEPAAASTAAKRK